MMCLMEVSPPVEVTTVTVADAVAVWPAPSSAVAVYVVLDDGDTDTDPLEACVPLTPEIVTEAAPLDVHVSVELPPGLIDVGEAVSVIERFADTVTVVVPVTVPPGPVAVAV